LTVLWELSPGWGVVDRPDDGEHGGALYAAPLATGVIHVVKGPAAVVCRAALTGRDRDGVLGAAAEALATSLDSIDEQAVEELLGDLVRVGVLRHVAPATAH
jgi:hypothetical protein